eukprot:TRINITY_DN5767_c0_g1_i5.p1 TRINITY_DN5767_c0_g1~~TRINITY_DN5767_c0_g1_i5.p1  ORF type:complete len:124 (-),score=10.54 TRINITY_DN5767_c0_g1_i5:206-544(-)
MNLLSQCFLAVLVSQTVLGLGNSLFVLADYNYSLSLFGFYALAHSSTYGYVCVCLPSQQTHFLVHSFCICSVCHSRYREAVVVATCTFRSHIGVNEYDGELLLRVTTLWNWP